MADHIEHNQLIKDLETLGVSISDEETSGVCVDMTEAHIKITHIKIVDGIITEFEIK